MAVEVDNADGPVCSVHTPQKGQSDCMISAERDDPWQRLSSFGRSFFLSVSCGEAAKDAAVTCFDLLNRVCIVIAGDDLEIDLTLKFRSGERTYEVTGISPQSNTVAQLLNGFVSRGTL